ncbi:MAG TPA: nuclear transport factor 2 family protein, partial [Prosthecobacter sp.]|nr:nuclear transport factor 2 family protein [Prosthecobacter sp.]
MIHSFATSVRLKDVEAMLSHCTPDLIVFDLVPPLRHEGLAAVREVWTKAVSSFQAPLDFEMKHLKIFVEGRIAFARSVNRFGGKRLQGGQNDMLSCMTLGLRKIGRDWSSCISTYPCPLTWR